MIQLNINTLRDVLIKNKIFFYVLFGLIVSFGIIYNIYHPNVKVDATQKPKAENRYYEKKNIHSNPPNESTGYSIKNSKDIIVKNNISIGYDEGYEIQDSENIDVIDNIAK